LSCDSAPRNTLVSGKLVSKKPHVSVVLTLKFGRRPLFHVPTPLALMRTSLAHPPFRSATLMAHESSGTSGTCRGSARQGQAGRVRRDGASPTVKRRTAACRKSRGERRGGPPLGNGDNRYEPTKAVKHGDSMEHASSKPKNACSYRQWVCWAGSREGLRGEGMHLHVIGVGPAPRDDAHRISFVLEEVD
jgi:hypothetical protein